MGFLGVCLPIHFNGMILGGLCEVPGYCVGSLYTDGQGLAMRILLGRVSCLLQEDEECVPPSPHGWTLLMLQAQPVSEVCNPARDVWDPARKRGAARNVSVFPSSLR